MLPARGIFFCFADQKFDAFGLLFWFTVPCLKKRKKLLCSFKEGAIGDEKFLTYEKVFWDVFF